MAVDTAGIRDFCTRSTSVKHALQDEMPRHNQYFVQSTRVANNEERGRSVKRRRV